MSKKIDKKINQYLKEVSSIINIKYAYIFGSYIYKKNNKNSDIDIAIFSPDVNNENNIELLKKLLIKVIKYKMDFQPILFNLKDYHSKDSEFIKNEILEKGKLLMQN